MCVTSKTVCKLKLLFDFQSGFRKDYSTDSYLLYLADQIRKENDSEKTCTDWSRRTKLFWHCELYCSSNRRIWEIKVIAVDWIASYLSDPTQIVEINGNYPIPSLLVYINVMSAACTCKLFLYTDDSALMVSHMDLNQLGNELTTISQWLMTTGFL